MIPVCSVFDFKKEKEWVEDVVLVSQLGLTMAGSILFCFAIGYYLDKWLNTKGLFISIFILESSTCLSSNVVSAFLTSVDV